MYILITGLSLFWIGLEFESCGCFQIFNIISEFWWKQKIEWALKKRPLFSKEMTKAFSFSFDLSFFFGQSSISGFLLNHILTTPLLPVLFKEKEAHFLGYFIVFTFDSFFSRGPLIIFFISCLFRVEKFRFHQHQVVDFMVSHVMIMYLKLLTPKHGAVGLGDLIIRFYYTFFSFCREYHIFLLLKAATVGYLISVIS